MKIKVTLRSYGRVKDKFIGSCYPTYRDDSSVYYNSLEGFKILSHGKRKDTIQIEAIPTLTELSEEEFFQLTLVWDYAINIYLAKAMQCLLIGAESDNMSSGIYDELEIEIAD